MKNREGTIGYCLGMDNTYEDYPFRDKNWTVIRHIDNKKVFAWIFEKDGHIWINVKCEPGFIVTMMYFLTKFSQIWLVLVFVPIIILVFHRIRKHYEAVGD
ncbi:MmcQ/YjbR family DNA-binding protein [Peribacillus frigoritolerans]|uniref:MmcQ/YjbR family DNA-binding protein n=1 Tax=Peribacillus frigoritolerans TaxID=450367 RepID=UPI00342B36FC